MRWVSSGAGALIKKNIPLLLLREKQRQREAETGTGETHPSVDNNSPKHSGGERVSE